jgi:hypothetical protein
MKRSSPERSGSSGKHWQSTTVEPRHLHERKNEASQSEADKDRGEKMGRGETACSRCCSNGELLRRGLRLGRRDSAALELRRRRLEDGSTWLPVSWWRRLRRPAQCPEEKERWRSPGVEDGAACSGWWRGRGRGGDPMGLMLGSVQGSGRWSSGSTPARRRAGGGWGLTRRRERGVEQPSARRGGAFPAEDTTWRKALLRLVGVPYSGNVEAVLRPVSSEKEMMGSSSSAAWQHDAQAAQQQWEERLTGGAAKFLIFD